HRRLREPRRLPQLAGELDGLLEQRLRACERLLGRVPVRRTATEHVERAAARGALLRAGLVEDARGERLRLGGVRRIAGEIASDLRVELAPQGRVVPGEGQPAVERRLALARVPGGLAGAGQVEEGARVRAKRLLGQAPDDRNELERPQRVELEGRELGQQARGLDSLARLEEQAQRRAQLAEPRVHGGRPPRLLPAKLAAGGELLLDGTGKLPPAVAERAERKAEVDQAVEETGQPDGLCDELGGEQRQVAERTDGSALDLRQLVEREPDEVEEDARLLRERLDLDRGLLGPRDPRRGEHERRRPASGRDPEPARLLP